MSSGKTHYPSIQEVNPLVTSEMSTYKLPTSENDFNSSVNEWEKSDIPGLTKFDLERKVRQLLPSHVSNGNGNEIPNKINISAEKLEKIFDDEFKCPICLGTIKVTAAVTACLHRFCTSCIEKVLRTTGTQHDCPSCRKKLASRRATKPDSNFDTLIKLLNKKKRTNGESSSSTTNGEASDEEEVFDLEKYRKAYSNKKNELQQRSKKSLGQRAGQQSPGDANKRPRQEDSSGSPREVDVGKVLFALFPLPEWLNDPANQKQVHELSNSNKVEVNSTNCHLKCPYLRVPYLLKVGDLKQYVKKKYAMTQDQFAVLEIIYRLPDRDVVLDEYLTMRDVTLKFWDACSDFIMYFRLFPAGA